MERKKFFQILVLAILFMSYVPSLISAKQEYAVRESKNCPFCHSRDGPPQLNEVGVYYGTNNHSIEGYVPAPRVTPTPEPTEEIEIGVHMSTWDVGLTALATILLMLIAVYAIRL